MLTERRKALKKEELKKKELYEAVDVKLVCFNCGDVITGSTAMDEDDWDEWT